MKKGLIVVALFALFFVSAIAAGAKTYQATGTVLSVTGDVVTIQKGSEKWDISVPQGTKGADDMKVGSKVTIMYTMTATSVEIKPEAKAPAKKTATTKK